VFLEIRFLARTPANATFFCLLLIIFLSAIPFGTADPFSKSILIVSVCVVAVLRIVVDRTFRFSEAAMLLPLVSVLLLAIMQTLPLPWTAGTTLSMAPYDTKIFIITLAALIMAAEFLFSYMDSPQRLKPLIAVVLITAGASAAFGILRDITLDREGVFAGYFGQETQNYAQFLNRNHFVFLMEMALGLTLGLVLRGRLSAWLKILFWMLAALFLYSSIAANSRGGMISIAVLGAFATIFHIMTRERSERRERNSAFPAGRVWRKAILAALLSCSVLAVFLFTIAIVGGDAVVDRFEKLPREFQTSEDTSANRLLIWKAAAHLIEEKPLLGVGFGAFANAVTKYDESGGEWVPEQAHDEYLEILANGGVVAFALFAGFSIIFVRRALENLRADDVLRSSSCFGALIGIAGVMVHSIVDFGLHIMVNALIFIVLIVIASARVPVSPRSVDKARVYV
jgi:O-antigen ligase